MDSTHIILVDDNEDSLEILQFFIEQLPGYLIVDKCRNGEELIDSIMKNPVDVILLDINMPKLNGMDAIRSCLKIRKDLRFIFITSYDEYAVEAFELSAVDYLVKPIEKTRLYTALERAKKYRIHEDSQLKPQYRPEERLVLRDHHNYFYIPLAEIIFIEKVSKKCHLYTSSKTYTVNNNISDIMNKLPSDLFFMSHRSYIINTAKISHITAKNHTFLAYFPDTEKHAHVSKLKIEELQKKMRTFNKS